jgi:hypothetical protein
MSNDAEPELRPGRIPGRARNMIVRHRLPPFPGPFMEPFFRCLPLYFKPFPQSHRHALRGKIDPHIAATPFRAATVMGAINSSSRAMPSRRFASKASTSDSGRRDSSKRGMNRARAVFQNGLSAKLSSHQTRHRSKVRSLIPNAKRNCSTRFGFNPCIMALTSTTTTPAYTFRPRNRTLGGVFRFRQPSFAQQKL